MTVSLDKTSNLQNVVDLCPDVFIYTTLEPIHCGLLSFRLFATKPKFSKISGSRGFVNNISWKMRL